MCPIDFDWRKQSVLVVAIGVDDVYNQWKFVELFFGMVNYFFYNLRIILLI